MRRDAYQLYPIRSPTTSRQRLFPRLTFTCDATIVRLVFLAMWEEVTEGGKIPEFQVWRRAGESDTEYYKIAATTAEGSFCNGYICERVPAERLPVSSGDVFGLHQPHKDVNTIEVMYQNGGGGFVHYRTEVEEPLSVFNLTGTDQSPDHILVAVVTGEVACSSLDTRCILHGG